MVPADGIDAFFAAPQGTYLAAQTWLFFCWDERLFGQVYWGRPDALDLERLLSLWQVELAPSTPPHASYIDCSRLDTVNAEHFVVLARELARNRAPLANKLARQAIVRPRGFTGAIVAGIGDVLPIPYPLQIFTTPAEALAWLGSPSALGGIEAIIAAVTREDTLLGGLRDHLRLYADATADDAAAALAVSTRTMQRRLSELGTSFRSEQQTARLQRAQHLLAETDLPITAIAIEVGCASVQQLADLFRRATNSTPTAWRQRHRKR